MESWNYGSPISNSKPPLMEGHHRQCLLNLTRHCLMKWNRKGLNQGLNQLLQKEVQDLSPWLKL